MTYADAIRQALEDAMAADPSVVILGQAVDDPKPTYGTTAGLTEKFGQGRAFNTPLSEEGMTGVAVGMALAGLRPVLTHIRMDFLVLGMNQLVNVASKVRWMYGGRLTCPLVIRGIIGKSWGQGPQHSQGLYPLFCHIPGLRVATPWQPDCAYVALRQALRLDEPTIFVEHRLLHRLEGPMELASLAKDADDLKVMSHSVAWPDAQVTLMGISWMAEECLRAAHLLAEAGIYAEVVSPVWLSPLEDGAIRDSVRRTGRLVAVDCAWVMGGIGSEIVARFSEEGILPAGQMRRLGFAPTACPTSPALEASYYPTPRTIAKAAMALLGEPKWEPGKVAPEIAFKGPF